MAGGAAFAATGAAVPVVREWTTASGVVGASAITGIPTAITASGQSDAFDISTIAHAMASIACTGSTGSPSVQFVLEVQDTLGTWLTVLGNPALAALTGAGFTYASVGPGCATTYALTRSARFRWTFSGTGSITGVGASLSGH